MTPRPLRSSDARVEDALAAVGSVSPTAVHSLLGQPAVVVVDVRDAADWSAEHIPGSINAPRGMLEFYMDPQSSFHMPAFDTEEATQYLFCCGSGARAALSARLAHDMGLRASCMAGGMRAWRAAGLPTEAAPDLSKSIERKP